MAGGPTGPRYFGKILPAIGFVEPFRRHRDFLARMTRRIDQYLEAADATSAAATDRPRPKGKPRVEQRRRGRPRERNRRRPAPRSSPRIRVDGCDPPVVQLECRRAAVLEERRQHSGVDQDEAVVEARRRSGRLRGVCPVTNRSTPNFLRTGVTCLSLLSWVSGHCANPRNQSGPSGSNKDDLPTASSAWS